jgi:taurine dioxygenase
MTVTSVAGLTVSPITSTIGAEIGGIDLTQPLSPDEVEVIAAALHTHGVVFFRDQPITDEQQRDRALQFGTPEIFAFAAGVHPDIPEVHAVTFDDGSLAKGRNADAWHSDATWMAEPPYGSILRAVELPAVGGDTCWADTAAAYDDLSSAMQRLLDEMTATHDFIKSFGPFFEGPDGPARYEAIRAKHPPVVHPVVRVHPVTKRKALYVNRNFTTRLDGLTERENEVLLPFLCDHVRSPDFQCRFRWTPGSIAFWDNRGTQHYAVPDYSGRRVMHRVILAGDRPVGPSET